MKNVLITGASRGIGLEFATQLSAENIHVFASCRHPERAEQLQQLAKKQKNVIIKKLDVSDDQSILALAKELKNDPLDWLINNAGISGESGVTVGNIKRDNFLQVFNVNCLSAVKVCDVFLPQLERGLDKLIICISSAMSSITENEFGRSYAYRSSKAALNCVMRSFAIDVAAKGIHVMLLHPGWVKTELGGADATIDPATSVSAMLKIIAEHKDTSHAEVLRSYDNRVIPW